MSKRISVRMNIMVYEQIYKIQEIIEKDYPGVKVTITDVINIAVMSLYESLNKRTDYT